MKPSSLVPLVAFLLLLLSSAELSLSQGLPKYCPTKMTFPKDCPETGASSQCVLDVLGALGAASMPKNCICRPAGANQHSCACQIVCP